MKYLVIHVGEDGTSAEILPKAILESRLAEDYWSAEEVVEHVPDGRIDLEGGTPRLYIMKGDFVSPRIIETVTRMELP